MERNILASQNSQGVVELKKKKKKCKYLEQNVAVFRVV
jgi:hypothetical protein